MNWRLDDLNEFTFCLSHAAQGCSKAVSGPNMVVLAHKAAYRSDAYFGDHKEPHASVLDNYFMG
jgi:hypothetical protein